MAAKRVLVVGDVHSLWSKKDEAATQFLHPDVVVFVGDFGEEDVELVKEIAAFDVCKAVILGNHDAWNVGSRHRKGDMTGVHAQLQALGPWHIGFGHLEVMGKDMTVAGARPFSWGGKGFRGMLPAYQQLYGVGCTADSAKRIVQVVKQIPPQHDVVLIGHNGPTGLGSKAHDICGVDFKPEQGDHGDQDLQEALKELKAAKRHVALVAFGHMHEDLGYFHGTRRRVCIDPSSATVFLNAAVVPRVRHKLDSKDTMHHFCLAEIQDAVITSVKDVWVQASHAGEDDAPRYSIGMERQLLKLSSRASTDSDPASPGTQTVCWELLDTYKNEWVKVTAQLIM